jgi:transketolase
MNRVIQKAPFADALVALGERRKDVVVLSADLSKYTDVLPFAQKFPNRFIQVGMAEQNMMGIAGGLKKAGFLPLAVTYGVFATRRAYEQVAMALCTGSSPAIIVAFLPGITTPFKATHQATEDLALMRGIPSMTVVDPVDGTELTSALNAAANQSGPVYIRGIRGEVEQLFPPENFDFELGKARVLTDGGDVAIISTGLGTNWALESIEILEQEQIKSTHLHVPTLKPIDREAIEAIARRFSRIYVVENHSVIGGLASAAASVISEVGIPTKLIPLGIPDLWAPAGSVSYIREQLGLSANAIAQKIKTQEANS